jgi:transketolase
MAIAEAHLAAEFNQPGHEIVHHYTYGLVTDGDLMEGVASEAASLAGHLRLGKLIYLYDDNRITIDGSTDLAFTEDRAARFRSYNWHVQEVPDGNDLGAIDHAIQSAKADARPSLILCRTHIGYGLPHKQDTAEAHGEPPGEEELEGARRKLVWPLEPRFYIPEELLSCWDKQLDAYRREYPKQADELERRLSGKLTNGWETFLPQFPADSKGQATRVSSGKVINALADCLPELIGGSADLTTSTRTFINSSPAFQANSPHGRNFHFGVREHAMGALVNGLALHGGVIPFGATFLVFSDYMRPSIRLSALSHARSIWVFTHDSIGLGEDGPTHQPVEHYAALRAIPNLVVIRPADANEVSEAWRFAIPRQDGPTALLLTRQNVPTLDRSIYAPATGLQRGAYILADLGGSNPELILMGSGSEVSLIVSAGEILASEGLRVRLVSFPSWELFAAQDQSYCDDVLPPSIILRLAVETGVSLGWERWVGDKGRIISVERFGASAPYKILFEQYGFTINNVVETAKMMIEAARQQV